MTSTERQRAFRQRQVNRIAELEAIAAMHEVTVSDLRDRLATADGALDDANAEIERLAALACKHPSIVVSRGRCQACGSETYASA